MNNLYEEYNSNIFNDGTGRYTEGFGIYENKSVEQEVITVKAPEGNKENINNKEDKENKEAPKKNKGKRKNHKRISVEGEFMKTKYNDNVYGWLQYNSFADEISKGEYKTLTPKYIIDDLEPWKIIYKEYTPSGAKRKFKDEIKKYYKAGFIKDVIYKNKSGVEVECYELVYDKDELYYLISDRLLEYLVNTKSVHSIRILCYLAFKFNANKYYTFTQKELLRNVLGVKSVTNKDTNAMVEDILFDLQASGLIGIHEKYISLNGKATRVRQIKWIDLLPTDLKEYFDRKKRY